MKLGVQRVSMGAGNDSQRAIRRVELVEVYHELCGSVLAGTRVRMPPGIADIVVSIGDDADRISTEYLFCNVGKTRIVDQ